MTLNFRVFFAGLVLRPCLDMASFHLEKDLKARVSLWFDLVMKLCFIFSLQVTGGRSTLCFIYTPERKKCKVKLCELFPEAVCAIVSGTNQRDVSLGSRRYASIPIGRDYVSKLPHSPLLPPVREIFQSVCSEKIQK